MEEVQAVTPWYRSPFWLAVVGLALMFGGYQASVYVPPPTPHEARQADQLAELRNAAQDEALRGRLDDVAKNAQHRPFLWPGRLLILVGVLMAVSAAVSMTRQPSQPAQEPIAPDPDDFAPDEEAEVKVDRQA